MNRFLELTLKGFNTLSSILDWFAPIFALSIRIYLTNVFLWSGWLKMTDWVTTVNLFTYEFKVPIVSPVFAAYVGTAAELIFPVFLLLGLGGRIPAVGLFIFNFISVISYPILLSAAGECMVKDHILWSVLIGVIIVYGHGIFSIDHLIHRKYKNYHY